MNPENTNICFLNVLGGVRSKFIARAAALQHRFKQKRQSRKWKRWWFLMLVTYTATIFQKVQQVLWAVGVEGRSSKPRPATYKRASGEEACTD